MQRGAPGGVEMGDDFVEGDAIPRGTVISTTDIYHAVRLEKYVPRSHSAERRRDDALCQELDKYHAMLSVEGVHLDSKQLSGIYDKLEAFNADVARSDSGYKLLANRKLGGVLKKLDNAMKEADPFTKAGMISRACALLVAFKNRFSIWRDGQVQGINDYNKVREDGFRAMRDLRLKGVLLDLAKKLESEEGLGVACTLVSDRVMISALRVAKAKIAMGKHSEALNIIRACGESLKSEWLKRPLRDAYLFITHSMADRRIGWRKEARIIIEGSARLLGQRNPRYILDELKKTRDAYLEGEGNAIALMEAGNRKIREALSGDPIRNALAWVGKLKDEAEGTQLAVLYRELISGNPKGIQERNGLLKEAGHSYRQAAGKLITI